MEGDQPASKKKKMDVKTRKAWSEEEELQILELWEQYEHQLRKQKRNSHVYSEMAKEMGSKFNAHEVHVKIRNLSQRYRNEKKDIGPSGGSPSSWKYYDKVHKIIGSNATNNSIIIETFDFQTPSTSSGSFAESPYSSPVSSPPVSTPLTVTIPAISPSASSESLNPESTKKKNAKFEKEVLKNMSENISKQTEQGDEQLGLLRNLCQHFENFVEHQQQNDQQFLAILKTLVEKN